MIAWKSLRFRWYQHYVDGCTGPANLFLVDGCDDASNISWAWFETPLPSAMKLPSDNLPYLFSSRWSAPVSDSVDASEGLS